MWSHDLQQDIVLILILCNWSPFRAHQGAAYSVVPYPIGVKGGVTWTLQQRNVQHLGFVVN